MVSPPSAGSVPELVDRAADGQARAIARLISMIENRSPVLRQVMAELVTRPRARSRPAHVIGITGAPGVGKSTSTNALISELRRRGSRVGVLAVDPSSPFSGGALLGDRVRMQDHSLDRGVFIRSMASRGHLGGLAWATPQAVRVLEVAGCDQILIETVGVGQSEVEIAGLADTTVVLLAPGMGDGIQAAKAGLLEVGDVYVVNKADREGAVHVARDLRAMLTLSERLPGAWLPPVLKSVASADEGLVEVADALEEHRVWSEQTGALNSRRERRTAEEIQAIAVATLRTRWAGESAREPAGSADSTAGRVGVSSLAQEVLAGALDPYAAADRLLGESL